MDFPRRGVKEVHVLVLETFVVLQGDDLQIVDGLMGLRWVLGAETHAHYVFGLIGDFGQLERQFLVGFEGVGGEDEPGADGGSLGGGVVVGEAEVVPVVGVETQG